MNKFLKNNLSKIISIFILLQPIIDLITGLCINLFNFNLTLGIIVRILFLALIMYITVFIYKKKTSLWVYLSIIFYSVLFLIGIVSFNDGLVFQEIQGLVRVFYFPILLISLYELKDDIRISNMTLITTLMMYLVFIFIPTLFNVGFQSYQITKSGTLGFYNSANEISGIISLLTPIMFILLKGKNNLILKTVLVLIYLIVILMVGTKTPLLSLMITIGITFLYYIITCIKKKTYKPIIYTATIIIIGLASLTLILPKTNFYKNIQVHLDFLEVDNIFEVFTEPELVDHFIFSQRLTFLENKQFLYEYSNLYEKINGVGYVKNNKVTKLVEMDYFDIFYSHGILGFILFFGIYGYVLHKVLKEKQKLTYERTMTLLSIVLVILLSLFTGHIITAPAVSLLVVLLILSAAKKTKKRVLFTTYNFDIGGIEKALVNLLNRIDYKKYSVDVIVEEKKGIFLPKITPKANIIEVKVSNNKNVILRKIINMSRKLIFALFDYHNYDCSICYATYSYSGNKLSLMASRNTAFYIHSNYTYIYEDINEFKSFFESRNISKFRKIIFVANEARRDFIKKYPEYEKKCITINNFNDIEAIKQGALEKVDAKKKKNTILFIFVGRLEDASKKMRRALNVIKETKKTELWVIGDGPDRQLYEDYVKKNKLTTRVTFFGKKQNPYPYMKQADYTILTSDYEGYPVVYLESIVLGTKIITTIDVSDEAMNIGKDFAYIVSKDEQQMVKEVKDILDNKVNKKFKKVDLEEIQKKRIKKIEELFDEVI